jgi:phosphoribosylformylglycinamidine cyclo-ligase
MGSWTVLPIFEYIQKCGNIDRNEMFATFNMGIGMIMIVEEDKAEAVMNLLSEAGEKSSVIGKIVTGEGVCLC